MTDQNWDRNQEFSAGSEGSDVGQSPEMLEAQPGVFEAGQRRTNIPVPEDQREELQGVQGPGGDSRPDMTDPHSGGFDDITEDPRNTTIRDPHDQPDVQKPDPAFLEAHRVDREDEIAVDPSKGSTDGQKLQPRTQVTDKSDNEL